MTYLANKPPHNWNDDDKVKYQIRLSDLARRFIHFETVYFGHKAIVEKDMKNFEQSEAFRIGITTLNEEEKEKVVSIGKKDSGKVQIIENRINKLLDKEKVKPELRLALLAKLSQKLIDEISE